MAVTRLHARHHSYRGGRTSSKTIGGRVGRSGRRQQQPLVVVRASDAQVTEGAEGGGGGLDVVSELIQNGSTAPAGDSGGSEGASDAAQEALKAYESMLGDSGSSMLKKSGGGMGGGGGGAGGGFSLPSLDSIKLPEFNLSAPKVDVPDVESLKSSMKEIKVPEIKVPELSFSLPEAGEGPDLPKVDLPALPSFDIDLPSLPDTSSVTDALLKAKALSQSALGASSETTAAAIDKVTTLLAAGEEQVVETLTALQTQLPAPLQPAITYALAHPTQALLSPLFLLFLTSIASYIVQYTGYAGEYKPAECLRRLSEEEDVILVDVRKESEQGSNGVPLLRKGARGKGIGLPLQTTLITARERGKMADTKDVELRIAALLIQGLKQVKPTTKIIVMDNNGGGGVAREVARRLTELGVRRAYMMQGGMSQWKREGLSISNSYLGGGTARILADSAEDTIKEIVEEPSSLLPGVGAVAAAALLVYNWHITLQLIGIVGVLYTLFSTVTEGIDEVPSSQEELEGAISLGLGNTRRGVVEAAGAVGGAASKVTQAMEEASGKEVGGGGSSAEEE